MGYNHHVEIVYFTYNFVVSIFEGSEREHTNEGQQSRDGGEGWDLGNELQEKDSWRGWKNSKNTLEKNFFFLTHL